MKQKKESNPLNIRKVGLLDKISLFGGDFEYWHCPSCQGKIIISKVGDHECPFCNNSITLLNCSECQEENLLITGSKVSCGSCDYIFNSKKISKQKKKIKEPKKESQMSNTEKLYNEFPHISEEPKEFNFGSMVGYAMMMLSISWDDDGDQDELQVIFKKVLTMFGVPVRMNGDQANEIWNELRLWYNALTDLPNHGKDEKYKIVEWIIESVKNPTGKIEDDIADMILQETADPTKLADKDWAPSYMLQALIDVANANNEITDKEMSFLLWCANRLGYDMFDNFDNLTFSKSSEEKSEPEHSEDETSDSSAETPTEPVESSDNPIESFREFMAGEFPGMKLPKNKNYGQCDISSGMLICFMAKKSSVSTYLYSSGKLPAKKVFEKINSLGLSGKVINDKYTLTPMTGSRNPNVVRIDIEIKYDGRELNSAEMRAEVKDVYGQLLELCMPIAEGKKG